MSHLEFIASIAQTRDEYLAMKKIGFFSALAAFFTGTACSNASPSALAVGDPVPSVSAKDHTGAAFDPAKYAASGWTLFFFYPKAFTPGCTAQSCSVRDSWAEFEKRGIRAVGISTDDIETQAKFVSEKKFPYLLVADSDKAVSKAFGMSGLAGFVKRGAFLAKDGKIVWIDPKGSTADQANAVLAAYDAILAAN